MPAVLRSVAKTDTLEIQRQTINLLAQDVYNLGGGSGTGGLAGTFSLSNGSRFAPSLNFTNQLQTGVYLSGNSFSIASLTTEAAKFNGELISFYKTFKIQDAVIDSLSIQTEGFNYNPGIFTATLLEGGSGTGATINATVSPFVGNITNAGSGYVAGTYSDIPVLGGSGEGATADFVVRGLEGSIINGGSGYLGNIYTNVPLQGGSGSGAIANVTASGGSIIEVEITNNGTGYALNDILTVSNVDLILPLSLGGGISPGSGFQYQITASPYVVTSVTATSNGIGGYEIGDVLSVSNKTIGAGPTSGTITAAGSNYTDGDYTDIDVYNVPTQTFVVTTTPNLGTPPPQNVYQIDGNTQQTLSLNIGNTYRFDISSSTNDTHPFIFLGEDYSPLPDGIVVITKGSSGVAGSFVDLIIKPTVANNTVLVYSCTAHPGMGAEINITTGSAGSYIDGAKANITVSGGSITNFVITYPGNDSKNNDIVSILPADIGGTGSGFSYQITSASVGSGSGFQYTLTEVGSLTNVVKAGDGSGYQKDDVLTPRIPFRYKIKSYGWPGVSAPFKFWIDANDGNGYVQNPTLTFHRGYTYIFDYSDDTNFPHGFNISTTNDGIHNGGIPFTTGVTIDNATRTLTIVVDNTTPSVLYYYCTVQSSLHSAMGGTINISSADRTDIIQPEILIDSISPVDSVVLNLDGSLEASNIDADSVSCQSVNAATNVNVANLSLSGSSISSINSQNLTLSPANDLVISGGLVGSIGKKLLIKDSLSSDKVVIDTETGNITGYGNISLDETTSSISVANKLKIEGVLIEEITDVPLSGNGVGITIRPDANKSVFVDASSSLAIPHGTTSERPADATLGSVRFNTTVSQYEGYNGTSWSSLGGVRDVDGNTYIAAETSPGSNENTLYFVNNSKDTFRIEEDSVSFYNARQINSFDILGLLAWEPLTPFDLNDEIYTEDDVYRVTTAGTTASTAPSHTTGTSVNGSAELLWLRKSYGTLTFTNKSSGIAINTTTTWNNNLRLSNNIISSLIDDISLQPSSGKKVSINATTSLVLPVGGTSNRGAPSTGSVRYNTDFSSFEGYNGTNWTSLGGVKDVDGNTYIIPESSPGSNENILYFYNDNNNTLNVTTSQLIFKSIDIISSDSNNLDINIDTVSFANDKLTITNTSSTKILSTLSDFDIGLSSGVYSDTLLRLTSTGQFIVNKTFGTGSFTGNTVLNSTLKFLELEDTKIVTSDIALTKGSVNSGSTVVYFPSTDVGTKLIVSAFNTTTGDKEIVEYTVCNTSTEIYHNAYGEVRTNINLINIAFDFDASSNVRLTTTLSDDVTSGDNVDVTIISNVIKK